MIILTAAGLECWLLGGVVPNPHLGKVYEGMDYAVEDSGLEALFAGPTDEERLHAAIRQLSPDQQEMVRAIYFENVSVNDYAARTGVTQSAISHRLQTVKKKLKKLLG